MTILRGMVNRPATHRSVGTRFPRRRAIHAKHPGATHPGTKHPSSMLAACLLTALIIALEPSAPAQQTVPSVVQGTPVQGTPSGVMQRYGSFSIVWPAQPRLVENPVTSTTSAAVYAVTQPPFTFTLSFLQFSSPQEMVSPQDFARNQTSNPPGETILSVSTAKLAGYPADEVIYRIGQVTYLAWSVQPTRQVDYVITAAGPDSPAFRQRAQQFASSFSAAR